MRIAFDIGGTLSKWPGIFRPLVNALCASNSIEVFVISDMHDVAKMAAMVIGNGMNVDPANVYSADFNKYGECCKAVLCRELKIDMLIDDHGGYVYVPGSPPVRLLVMPDPTQPYYADDWITDGSEGDFGRRCKGATMPGFQKTD